MSAVWKRRGTVVFAAKLVIVAIALAGMTACAKKKKEEPVAEQAVVTPPEAPIPPQQMQPRETSEVPEPMRGQVRSDENLRTVYFDFDSEALRKDTVEILAGNAKYLLSNPKLVVQVEGNCDERGTTEYNYNLGARRANSAIQYLVKAGVAPDRLHPISYGEDRPVALCPKEECYWKNRRVEFKVFVD